MISAIVLASEHHSGDDVEHAHEVAVRSLVWLVSAVVAGVVRDVVLAVPPGLGLSDVADQSGCELVKADDEAGRLAAAIAAARGPRLLFLRAGYQPDGRLSEEIDAFVRRTPDAAAALVLAAPETLGQRLFPVRAPAIGTLVARAACLETPPVSFARLVRGLRRPTRLLTRAVRIL